MPSDEFFSSLFATESVAAAGEAFTTADIAAQSAAISSSVAGTTAATASSAFPWSTLFTGLSAGSQLLQGVAGYKSGNANADYLNAAANQALAAGAANKDIADARNRAALGELKAGIGAQGTTMSGSPLLVYLNSVKNAAIEGQNEYYQGSLKSTGLRQQASIAKSDASSSLWKGIIGAGATLGSSLGSKLAA